VLTLALDTTTRQASAALVRDERVLAVTTGGATATHAERLPAELARLLDTAGVSLGDVELYAVGAGPGSFTGLRVGIATVQGLAMAHGRRIVPVSVLEALADAAPGTSAPVAVWMDAQRGQVFGSLYAAGDRAVLSPPTSLTPGDTLARWTPLADLRQAVFVGDGAVRYRDILTAHLGAPPEVVEPPPLAPIIGRIAARRPERAVLPHAVVPIYVRRSDVELARERQRTGR
jgi:tRNA threonylcarbamoyladenosine biosynthesis protein TsaB